MGSAIRLGLIGCGSRGPGAAINALTADADVRLVAMGDVFADKAERAHASLLQSDVGQRVAGERGDGAMKRFGGFNAYRGVIEHSDVVILAAPPHFQATHLRAAADAGRHVFVEPPGAVDVPGLRRLREALDVARITGTSVVAGFPHRYDPGQIEAVRRVRDDGAIGGVVTVQGDYLTVGRWMNPRQPGWDDMTWQLRNWRYFTWLSGDFVACDAVTAIDPVLWLMGDTPPAKVSAAGGRTQRIAAAYGNIYDHFTATLEWPDGRRALFACRQWNDADSHVGTTAFGTKGVAELRPPSVTIANGQSWKAKPAANMFDLEQRALIESIRSGKPIVDDADRLIRAAAVALMIRSSAYTGRTVFWDRGAAEAAKAPKDAAVIWKSVEDFRLPNYGFGAMPVAPVAMPGVTKFM